MERTYKNIVERFLIYYVSCLKDFSRNTLGINRERKGHHHLRTIEFYIEMIESYYKSQS